MIELTANFVSGTIPILFQHEFVPGIGASGAISGIMGVLAVRLIFKRLVFPVPLGFLSWILPIFLKIRITSLFVMAMYFFNDLVGGKLTLRGETTRIGYWAQLGGAITGIILGLR